MKSIWIPSKGLRIGVLIRIISSPSLKTSYPLFEWQETDSPNKDVIYRKWMFGEKAHSPLFHIEIFIGIYFKHERPHPKKYPDA